MDRFVTITGCSGGGKSTLLEALRRRGHAVVEEPGRRIVAEELAGAGTALPWTDPVAFARRAIDMALRDRAEAERRTGWVFFDRGLLDAASGLQHLIGGDHVAAIGRSYRYNGSVFMAPPWPEIYATDRERQHGFAEAVAEYERLRETYLSLGYDIRLLPKESVERRADFVLATLGI